MIRTVLPSRRSILQLGLGALGAAVGSGLLAACGSATPAAPTAGSQAAASPTPASSVAAATAAPESPTPASSGAVATVAPAATSAGAAKQNVSLETWTIKWGPQDMWPSTYRQVTAQTGATIKPVLLPVSDMETKILTALAGGVTPDLIYNHPIFNATYATKGVVIALDDYVRSSKTITLSDFVPAAVDFYRWPAKAKLWGLPVDSEADYLFYNKDLVQKAGLTDPGEVWKKDAKTWNQDLFDQYATKMTSGTGDSKVFGAAEPAKSLRIQACYIWGYNEDIFSPDLKTTLIATDGALQAWEYLKGFMTKGWSPSMTGSNVGGSINALLNSGRLGFYQAGRASELDNLNASLNVGMVPLPTLPNGVQATRNAPDGFAIGSKSKNVGVAWSALEVFATYGNDMIVKNKAGSPNRLSALQSKLWLDGLKPWEDMQMFLFIQKTARDVLLPPRFNEIDQIAQAAFDEVLLGRATAKDAMSGAASKIDDILKVVIQ